LGENAAGESQGEEGGKGFLPYLIAAVLRKLIRKWNSGRTRIIANMEKERTKFRLRSFWGWSGRANLWSAATHCRFLDRPRAAMNRRTPNTGATEARCRGVEVDPAVESGA
jgi:hypothetical protein